MTKTIELDVAQATLTELIEGLKPNEEVVIVRNRQPIAILLPSPRSHQRRQPGNCKGMLAVVSDDDDHLQDFSEYMP